MDKFLVESHESASDDTDDRLSTDLNKGYETINQIRTVDKIR